MDELARLRQFSPAPAPSAAARAQATLALREAIGGKRRRTSRPLVAVVAFLIAAGIATGAYAVIQSVIAGSPAPPSVKERERVLNTIKGELIPKAHPSPGIEYAKTRAAAAITTSAGPAYLWVAPDKRGDECVYQQIVANDLPGGRPNLSGGCQTPNQFYLGIGAERAKGHLLGLLQGHIPQKGARTVEVRFADGTSHTYEVTDGFVFAEVKPTEAVATATVRDTRGHVLAVRTTKAPLSPLAASAEMRSKFRVTAPWRTVATLHPIGAKGQFVLKTAPGTNGTVCIELIGGGGTGRGCGRPIGPTDLDIGPTQIGPAPHGWFLIDGPVGSQVRSLVLHFEDGTAVSIPIHKGFILYQVNPKNFVSGHRPTELVARDASGKVVRTRKFGFLP
jgi:hypothetical protein